MLRLRAFDSSSTGVYFVTICTHERRRILGEVFGDDVLLSPAGSIVEHQIQQSPSRLGGATVNSYVVMPTHVHLLIHISEEADGRARQASPLRVVVGAFKSGSAREINVVHGTPGAPVWQRGYYDHVIRDDVKHNPIRWALYPENP